MSKKPLTPYEQHMANGARILAELDAELERTNKEAKQKWPTT